MAFSLYEHFELFTKHFSIFQNRSKERFLPITNRINKIVIITPDAELNVLNYDVDNVRIHKDKMNDVRKIKPCYNSHFSHEPYVTKPTHVTTRNGLRKGLTRNSLPDVKFTHQYKVFREPINGNNIDKNNYVYE